MRREESEFTLHLPSVKLEKKRKTKTAMTHLSYHQNPQMKRYPDATDTVVFSSNPSGKTRLHPVKHRHSVLSHERY